MRILLVEDDPELADSLARALKNGGWTVDVLHDGVAADLALRSEDYALAILDVGLPRQDGFEVLKNLRERGQTLAVLMLTARGEEYSQVAGFDAGADDYITKPIKPKVLVSKVKALLRRLKDDKKEVEDIVKVGEIVINREEYKIVNNGEEMVLPRKEFELLSLLTSKPNKVFKREVILDKVWGNEVVVGGRTIDVHIRKLREKIGDDHFKTVKGVGYKFVL